MKVKKAYLYSAIAILLVATSVFFTIFGNNGKAYNYAKKDLSKYVSGLVYEGINIDGVEWEQIAADKSDVHAKIAALLKAAAMKNNNNTLPSTTKGTINAYDIAVFNYYGVYTDDQGKEVIFTAGSTMDPSVANDFQIHATAAANKLFGEELNKLFNEALINKNVVDFSYNTQTSGYLHEKDVVYISYTTTASGATEQPNVRINLADGKDAIDAEYGEGFYDKLMATPIGQTLKATTEKPLKFGEKDYSTLKIRWAVRDTFSKASASFVDGDVIFAIVTFKDANSKVEYAVKVVKGDEANAVVYNVTRGEVVGADSTTKLDRAVIDKICASVINGSGTVEYAPATDAAAKWNEGDHYKWVKEVYNLVDQTEVTAPKSDVTYYTQDKDSGEYVKCAANLTAWAEDTAYYTLTTAHYEKVDKTKDAYEEGTNYFVSIGAHTYNVKSVVRENADAADIKEAFKGIEISYKYADDATDKAQDGTELKGKDVVFHVFVTGVRDIKTDYTTISAISGGFDSLDAKRLVAIKTALTSYDSALKAVNDLFGTDNKEAVEAYVAAFKAYRADDSDANKTAYETAHAALVALEISGKTEQNKKDALTKFETAYDTLQRTVAVYYAEKVAADINKADKAYGEALAALNTLVGEENAALVEAYIAALAAYRADSENKKADYDAAKDAIAALAIEGTDAALSAFETAYDELHSVVLASYTNLENAVAVSNAIVAVKEALDVFGDEDLVDAYISAWLTHKSTDGDTNKTAYENAYNALVALEVEGKDEAAKKALLKAYEDAYVALEKEAKASSIHVVDDWMSNEAFEVLLVDAEDDLKAEYKNNYINGVVEVLWEEILKGVTVELPKKAVRLAVKDQMDSYKQTYYTSKYKNHDSFKAYMKDEAFKGEADWEAALRADAEEMVKEHLVIFYLADVLGIDVSEKAITEDDVYAYNYMYLPEQTQTAFAFDKSFSHLLDEVYVDMLKTPRE